MILLLIVLIPTMAYSNSDDWLWEKSAKPLEIDLSGPKTVIVCTPNDGCQSATVYDD